MTIGFLKYHGLGNAYLVVEASQCGPRPSETWIQRICAPHTGVGSDGVLVRGPACSDGVESLRIFNPDGGEAEKSGNGLRIFARYLYDRSVVAEQPFSVDTPGGRVICQVSPGGGQVSVAMGRVSFDSAEIPVTGARREVLGESLLAGDVELEFSAATIGNPHCVILRRWISAAEARALGPAIERDSRFPNRTNVQFLQVLDRRNLRIEIWERGAGYTRASGSSSCAAAAVARRLGLCAAAVTVHMPGGRLAIEVTEDFDVRMIGPVQRVCWGTLSAEASAWSSEPLGARPRRDGT